MESKAAILAALAALGLWIVTPSRAADMSILPSDHVMGTVKAPVTLIEYAAPSCEVCARFNADILPGLKKDYIDKGKLLYVFRLWPLKPSDGAAEKIARCLPPSAYFPFLDLLFRNQNIWNGSRDPYAGLVRLARRMGLTAARVDHCIGDTAQDADINRIDAQGEAKYQVAGIPALVINGAALPSGIPDGNKLKALVDAALARK
jgi:protein-disulfide isomerase